MSGRTQYFLRALPEVAPKGHKTAFQRSKPKGGGTRNGLVKCPKRDRNPAHRRGGLAANSEPRTHMRPCGSCHSFSVACRWPSARATVRKSCAEKRSAMSV